MMAAYQPQQPGGMHPGMAHGHPGMAPNPGQHMGHPMMQPGVSGPGQPHVSQAGAMMGMQPGANGMTGGGMPGGQHMGMGMPGQGGQPGQPMGAGGPNAHPMGHMTQQQMMQQQQQQMQQAIPPQMMQQHQAALLRQRQMQAQAMGMQQGMPQSMQGMTPQQIMQLQQQGAGNHILPPHLRQQQISTQQRYMEQTQQAQMQQQMAMQQGHAQQGAQGQGGPPAQPGQPHPPQMRPQSRMANAGEQAQSQAPGQPGVQGQAQPNQVGQVSQQPPNQQPQGQTAGPQGQQQGPPPGVTPQQMQQIHMQRHRHMMMQQQAAAAQRQNMQAQQQSISGILILQLMLFADKLCSFGNANGKDILAWNEFVDKHFASEGRLLHSFDDGPNTKPKTYEVLRPTIARYFWTYFESGAQSLKLHTENAREMALPNGRSQVTCAHATLTVSYPSGARLEMHGTLNVQYTSSNPNSTNMIECLELQQNSAEEIISRVEVEKILSNWSPNLSNKSPKMTKNKIPKAQQKLQQQSEILTIDHFPKAPKGSMGVTSRVQQFLEIGETMNVMSELMSFANEKKMRPDAALEALVQQYETQGPQNLGNPHLNLQHHGSPMIHRTPSMPHMQMQQGPGGNFSSPSVSNMSLPMQNGMNGSPHISNHVGLQPGMMQNNSHTPSPHQSNMAAPQMMPQHSQQGTNSSAASANTSPNVNNQNKRRRSTVKAEDDGVDGNVQNRIKPSPRMNKKAKPGG